MSLWRSCEQSFLDNAIFLNVTTSEKKIGFLLIDIVKKLFNPQNDGHQGSNPGGLLLFIRNFQKTYKELAISSKKL